MKACISVIVFNSILIFSKEKHGIKKELSEEEIEQLTEYVLSL